MKNTYKKAKFVIVWGEIPPPPKALKKTLAMLHMHFPEQIEYATTVIGAELPAVFRDLLWTFSSIQMDH